MRVFGIAGWSGSGKTTLMVPLIAALRRRGLRVSSLKRGHHDIALDRPDDDSRRLRDAGAHEVLVAAPHRWALLHELRGTPEPLLAELAGRFSDCDLLLVEGIKHGSHPKLEVYRPELGKPLLCRDDPHIVAVATTARRLDIALPRLDLADVESIAGFIFRKLKEI